MTTDAANETTHPRNFRSKLADAANSQMNEQKNRLAARAGDLVQVVRQTAAELRQPSPGVARYVDSAADRLDEWVAVLRDRDAAELLDDVRELARQRPAIVIGGGFALGFIAARFLKSSRANGRGGVNDAWRDDYTREGSLT